MSPNQGSVREFFLFRNQLVGQLTRVPVCGGCQEGLGHPPVVFALTPLRGRSGGPFKVGGGGGLSGVCCQWLSWEHARRLLRRPGVSGIIPGLLASPSGSIWVCLFILRTFLISEFCSRKAFSEREEGTYVPRDHPISRAQSWVHHRLGPHGRKDSGWGGDSWPA